MMDRQDTEDVNLAATLGESLERLLLPTDEGAELSARKEASVVQKATPLSKKDLCCFVCLKQFDGELHVPRKMTNCEHTFCHKCVQEAIDLSPNCAQFGAQSILLTPQGALKCPIDQCILAPAITTAFDLKINQEVISALKIEIK